MDGTWMSRRVSGNRTHTDWTGHVGQTTHVRQEKVRNLSILLLTGQETNRDFGSNDE